MKSMHHCQPRAGLSSLYPPSRGGAGQYCLPMWRRRHSPAAAAGILSLLKRAGFNLPVYLLTDSDMAKPDGVTAIIGGKEQEWLELEAAACSYEENLLPPFFNTLTQYVEMDNSTFACPGHQHGAFFKTPGGPPVLTSLAKTSFAPICAMLM